MAQAYKVLLNGRSFHGGDMEWSLPTKNEDGTWTPGEWMSVDGELELCVNALHLTDHPAAWHSDGSEPYAAEYDETETVGEFDGGTMSKIGVRRCRLLHPVEWIEVGVFKEGSHTVNSNGVIRADGTARVHVYVNASVVAGGGSRVTVASEATCRVAAHGNAYVTFQGDGTLELYDHSTAYVCGQPASDGILVYAYGNAHVDTSGDGVTVEANDNASVTAAGGSVRAMGKASVTAYSKATVVASGDSRVNADHDVHVAAYDRASVQLSGTASVKAAGKAIVIAEQYWEGAAEISEMAVLLKRGIGNVEGHFYHKRADNLIEVRSAHSSAILRGDS